MSIAQEILRQIGQPALFMIGAKDFVSSKNGVSFRIRGSKTVNHLEIILEPSDTYRMIFRKIWGMNVKIVAEIDDVYCDSLHKMIEIHTGLYTRL